jgi:hypothetical protein
MEQHTPPGDPKHHLDAEVIFSGQGTDAEMEAMNIRGVLESNGITVITTPVFPMPTLAVEVRVPKDEVERARQALNEARSAGPEAAEREERAGEGTPSA